MGHFVGCLIRGACRETGPILFYEGSTNLEMSTQNSLITDYFNTCNSAKSQ